MGSVLLASLSGCELLELFHIIWVVVWVGSTEVRPTLGELSILVSTLDVHYYR